MEDFVTQIAGNHAIVVSLIKRGEEPHVFEPTPQHCVHLHDAQLLIINGLQFEPWIASLKKSAGFKGTEVIASRDVHALPSPANPKHSDPHAWHDVRNAMLYVRNITKALCEADPAHATYYKTRSQAYLKRLTILDAKIKQTTQALHDKDIVTTHNAFCYYGAAYGLHFFAPLGAEETLSAKQLCTLMNYIKTHKVRAVFGEPNQTMADTIARETGARMGGILYTDTLPADKGYVEMMEYNTATMCAAPQGPLNT